MRLDAKKLEALFVKKQNHSTLAGLLMEYAILKRKLEEPDGQSWYFKQGINPRKKRIAHLIKQFNAIKSTFNTRTIDAFLEKINENKAVCLHYEKRGINTIQQMHYSKLKAENAFLHELIGLKSKINQLKEIDHYLSHPEEFLLIID
jgi:formylmethanofuran dehydrogenase subunit B